LYDNWI
jgi:hypothetical protein